MIYFFLTTLRKNVLKIIIKSFEKLFVIASPRSNYKNAVLSLLSVAFFPRRKEADGRDLYQHLPKAKQESMQSTKLVT